MIYFLALIYFVLASSLISRVGDKLIKFIFFPEQICTMMKNKTINKKYHYEEKLKLEASILIRTWKSRNTYENKQRTKEWTYLFHFPWLFSILNN